MSKKAEQARIDAGYCRTFNNIALYTSDDVCIIYEEAYEQAEEDLALTAEDVSCIIHLADQFGKDYQRIADVFNKDREEEK